MSLFRKFFYRKPPDGLLEISERVYVFDCCFTTDVLENDEYKVYMGDITSQLMDNFPDSSFMVFNFREGEHQSFLTEILSEYDITVMDYPRQYEGCPLLTIEMVHHFLKSSESWLSLSQQNILLMHCEVGGWPVLAFMLAGLLIYRKQYTGEQKTLDMIYKQAPRELLQLLSPLNPLPSQMRYLQYISRRNVSSIWPPLDSTLFMDCVILRFIPNFHGYGGCRPLFRIFGHDPFTADDRTPKILFSTPKRSKAVQLYQQADCELGKFDIHCHVQGDVVLECISLDDDLERELMMFRVMFNTAFIRSNILMLNRDEIDILWDAKDRFLKNFRAEILFSEMDTSNSAITVELPHIGDKDGLPMEAFAKVQEIFSNLSWMDTKGDAPLHVLQQMAGSNVSKEKQATVPPQNETTEIIPQKSSPDLFKANPLTNDASDIITRSSPTTPRKKYISLLKHSSDTNAMNKKTQLPNVAMLHHPDQPKKISHFLQSSQSSPVLSRNSLQTSPTHVSRYHSAPSALGTLGITALLHDHDAFGRSEVAYSMPLPRSAPMLLPDSISAMPETSENRTASLTAPSPESQPLKLLPTPRTPLAAATNASLLTSLPMSPSVCLPFSESHLRNDPITPIIANSVVSLTIKAPSISLSTSGQKPSSLLLSSKVQSIPLPPPLPPPPLTPSSRKRSIPSVVSQKTPDIAKIIASNPSISNTSFPVKDNAFLPAKYEASSPFKGRASSLGKVQSTATTPPQPLLPSVGISSFSLAPSTTTYVLPPPPPPTPPSPPPLPPTISIKGMPSTASLPPPPPPPPSAIHRKDMQSTPFLTSPLHPTLTIIKKDKPSTVHLPPAPPSYPPSNSFPHASLLKDACPPPPPPPPSSSVPMLSVLASPPHHPSQNSSGPNVPTVPPSPCPSKGLSPFSGSSPLSGVSALPGGIKGPNLVRLMSNSNRSLHSSTKKASLKPLHWVKVTRAMQGSLWAETQKADEASRAPEFDMSELESLFSAAATNSERGSDDRSSGRSSLGQKSVRIQLIDLRRANNCEIMLTKVKIPLSDLMNSVLALDESVLDVDQVDNLIKFCPNKEEMDLLKNFNGDKERLGKCEQYFLELMKVPRVESKLRVFAFKIQFRSQVADLSVNLNIVNSASQEIRNSTKLKRIMQTILSLGNALNQGTARGSAIGFRLDSLLKLTDTRARNNKMTLMHYLCKVIAEKLPELLDFPKDLVSLEIASKIQLKALAEEMQSISKGLEKVEQELITSENDGSVSETFRKILKEFLVGAEAEVKALTSLYSNVGRNADALALYFGEDPARCPFEQVTNTLLNFMRLFIRAHEENCKHLELEKKKQHREAESEKMKLNSAKREGDLTHSPSKNARFR